MYLQRGMIVLPVAMATGTNGRRRLGGCSRGMIKRNAISAVRHPLAQTKRDRSVWRAHLTCLKYAVQARITQSS